MEVEVQKIERGRSQSCSFIFLPSVCDLGVGGLQLLVNSSILEIAIALWKYTVKTILGHSCKNATQGFQSFRQ